MINRSFVLFFTVVCIAFSSGQLCAQKTTTNLAKVKPAPVKPPMRQDLSSAKPSASALNQKVESAEPSNAVAAQTSGGFRTQDLLPANTKAWISVPDAKDLGDRFDRSQFGQLAKNKALKPFADSIKSQVKNWIDRQNVRLNLDIDQLEGVNSGEICFAGVLRDGGEHGIVFLMDVTNTRDKAVKLSERISKKLVARDATKKEGKIQGVAYTQLTLDKPKLFRTPRKTFKTIVDVKGEKKSSWMMVSNNESVFREVLRRLTHPERIQAVETLAAQKSFKSVMEQSDSEFKSQICWFVDPFGYHELAQRVRDEEAPNKVPRDNLAKKLAGSGFDAFRGIGGQIAITTGKHEILHRTFIYADRLKAGQKKVFELLDFKTNKDQPHTFPRWVPEEVSSIIIGDWNMQKALAAFGHFWDAQTKPGSWEQLLKDLKQDPNLRFDLAGVVEQLGNRFTVVSATERPIGPKSERVVISATLKGKSKFVFENISRANPDANVIMVGGMKFIEIDSTREIEGLEIEELDGLDLEIEEEEEEEEEEEKRFELFEKRYIAVAGESKDKSGTELLISNDKEYLKKILTSRKSKAGSAPDFVRIKTSLATLTDDTKVAWRQFGRLDKGLETNYEMLRRGEMASSQTMLARVINQIFNKQAAENARLEGKEFDPDAVRKQELDGATLPKNFSKSIAPYLGPTGSVLEVLDNGWRITGVVLKKDNASSTKVSTAKAMEHKLDAAKPPQVTPVAEKLSK